MKRLVGIVVLVIAAACGSSTAPASNLAGNWSGALTDSRGGPGTMTLNLTQSSNAVSGTWAATFSNAAGNNGGSLSGTTSGSGVSLALKSSDPSACPFNVSGTLSGTTITGVYAAFDCTIVVTGTFTATKH